MASMVKKAVIEVLLVDESVQATNRQIEKEIHEQLSRNLHAIPWAAKLEKVTVKGT
jgi:hypothetical protein